MKKKLFSSILTGAMVLSLVACGNTKQPETSKPSSSESQKTQEASTSTQVEEPEEIATLKCYFLGTPPAEADLTLVEEAISEITRKEIGAEVDMVIMDAGTMKEKMNVIMGSGEKFDVCFTGYCNKYATAAANGGLYDITEMLKETPGIEEHVPDYAMDQCYVDGKLYGVPNIQILCSYNVVYLKKDLVEKYNFDYKAAKELEDLEPFFEAIKENEPGIYPIGNEITATYCDREAKNTVFTAGAVEIDATTGQIDVWTEMPVYQKVLKRAKDWYDKGYIRQDIMTVTDPFQDVAAGKVAAWYAVGKPGGDIEQFNKYGVEVVEVAVTDPVLGNPTSTMLSVGANSENPMKALQFIELLNTNQEVHDLIIFGVEGVHYNRNAEGKVEPVEDSGYCQKGFTWAFGDQFITSLMYNQQDDLWEVTKAMNDAAGKPINYGFAIPTEINDAIKTETALINAVGGEYAKGLRYGTLDLDKTLADMKKRTEDSVKVIREKLQPIVDEWMASKK